MGSGGVGVQAKVPRHAVKRGQAAGARGDDIEQPLDVLHVAYVRDVPQVAADDRSDVAGEEARSATRAAALKLGIAAGCQHARGGGTADGCSGDGRKPCVEGRVDERLAGACQLALGKRREIDVPDATRKRVGDGGEREEVCRSGEQELPARLVAVEAPLDRQQQARYTLNLVDHRRAGDRGDETCRVFSRCVRRRLVVEADQSGGMLVCRDVCDERALTDLPGPQQRDGATFGKRFEDLRADVARKEVFRHLGRLA